MAESFYIVSGTYENSISGFFVEPLQEISKEKKEDLLFQVQPKFSYASHMGCIKALASNGQYLASGSTDETIKVYDLIKCIELGVLHQHTGVITSLEFFDDHLFSTSEDGTICIWRTQDWECLLIIRAHKKIVTDFSVHPSGRMGLSVSNEKKLKLWDLTSGKNAFVAKIDHEPQFIRWSPSGDSYAVVFLKSIDFYDKTATLFRNISLEHKINSICYLSEDTFCVGGDEGEIELFEVKTGELKNTIQTKHTRIKHISLAPNSENFLISGSSDGILDIWDINNSRKPLNSIFVAGRVTCCTSIHLKTKKEIQEEKNQKKRKREENKAKKNIKSKKQKIKEPTNNKQKNQKK